LELLFLAINLQWIFFSIKTNEISGAAIALLLIALAAVDAAIGLSLLLRYFSVSYTGKIQLSEMIHIKG
jgi:NADH:ubiquinone oxidoreductase subunit K